MESKHIVLCNIISVFQRIVKLHPQTFKFYSKGGYPYTIKELREGKRSRKIILSTMTLQQRLSSIYTMELTKDVMRALSIKLQQSSARCSVCWLFGI